MSRFGHRVLVLVVALGLAGCETKDKKAPPPSGEALSVKAGDLLNEYGNNAVAADNKYKGKLLKVTGKFSSAAKVPLMGYAVTLVGEDQEVTTSGIQCFIVESAQAAVGQMQPGQIVTLQGVCDGQQVGQIKLTKCTVAQ